MKHKIVTILAGGWSASLFDLRKLPGFVIAVNDAAIYSPRVDAVVSMDRIWAEHRFEQVRKLNVPIYLRKSTIRNFEIDDTVTAFENDHTSTVLSDKPSHLNGTHSGFCALNLAYQMRPKDLFLVGFDMKLGPRGERHWYPPYPWKSGGGSSSGKLAEWGQQFESAARQLSEAGVRAYLALQPEPEWSPFATVSRDTLERRSTLCAA